MALRHILISASCVLLAAVPSFADTATESFVRANANSVLQSLNDPELDDAGRRVAFQEYMDEFTNIDAVARFVIGRYSKRFSEEELEQYTAAFRVYALAVYEFYFNEFKGQSVEVVGSDDRPAQRPAGQPPRESIVKTEVIRADGTAMEVRWRVMNRRGDYQVVDVALEDNGNLIWLAIEQQAQFLSVLDRNNGSADALIAKIESMTEQLEDGEQPTG